MNTRASGAATDDLGTSASVLSGLSALGSSQAALLSLCSAFLKLLRPTGLTAGFSVPAFPSVPLETVSPEHEKWKMTQVGWKPG